MKTKYKLKCVPTMTNLVDKDYAELLKATDNGYESCVFICEYCFKTLKMYKHFGYTKVASTTIICRLKDCFEEAVYQLRSY